MRGAVVFFRGALGDSILTWPLLRALANEYELVAAVTDLSKAQLTQRAVVPSLVALNAEQELFNRLYVDGARIEAVEAAASIKLVLHLAPASERTAESLLVWERNAQRQYPHARIVIEKLELNRVTAMELAAKWGTPRPLPPRLHHGNHRACFFVGAGSAEKRWPLPHWTELRRACPQLAISFIAGEAELDRFSPPERKLFVAAGGRFLSSLVELEQTLRENSMFVGVDSGPTHLAAQMGLDTIALFGPTDPARWAPIGALVEVIRPDHPRGMAWLTVDQVATTIARRSAPH